VIASERAGMLRFSIDRGANPMVIAPKTPKSRGQDPVDIGIVRTHKGVDCPQMCFDPAELEGTEAIA